MHGAGGPDGTGYELELEKAEPATWRFRRNGALIGEGKMPPGAPVNLELYQLGSVMRFDADARPVFRYRDPDPLRSGYVDVTGLTSSRGAPEPQVTLKQAWATACVFHQEINAVSSMGLWAARSGRWVLGEDAEQLQGYLLGQPTDRKTAVLEYRGPLDACDLLLELRVFRFLLRRGHRLSIAMEAEGSRSPDVVTVEWPDPAKPVCRLRRDQREISAVPAMDPTNPAPVLTVLRTRTQLSLYLDQVLVTRMERAAEGGIGKLWLELESPSGESLGIASICLQENPLAAPRISEGRMQLVSFQNALVRGHAEGSRR